MQGGQGTMSSVMEAAANVAASAKSGLDKTKAVVEAKAEKISTRDQVEKDMASLRKEEKIDLAELRKCKAYAQNAVAAAGLAAPRFSDGGEFSTIGSFNQPPAAAATHNPDVAGSHTHCWIPPGNFVVEDVAGSHCPVVRPGTGQPGSSDKVSVTETNTTGNANVGEVVDTNPTHTGMPAPVVEPDGVASGFNTDSNTGSGTHFAMN